MQGTGKATKAVVEDIRSAANPLTFPAPPVHPTVASLPFQDIAWENFELLSLRLVDLDGRVEGARLYGERGQVQEGIDLYGELVSGGNRYIVYQCKRVETFGPADIRAVADTFLRETSDGQPLPPLLDEAGDPVEPWHAVTDTFVLCLSRSLSTTQQDRAWRDVKRRLAARGIKAELWDADALNRKLKQAPEIVNDIFGWSWVSPFCGPALAARIGTELGTYDMAQQVEQLTNLVNQMTGLIGGGVQVSPSSIEQLRLLLQSNALPAPAVREPVPAENDPLGMTLQTIQELITGGSYTLASTRLEGVRAEAEAASHEQRARFLRLEGTLLYRQQRTGAAERFLEAYRLDRDAESAGILKGLAHLLRGEPAIALGFLHDAQEQYPHRNDARAFYAHALDELGHEADLNRLEAGLTPEQDDLGLALARIHMSRRDIPAMRRVLAVLDGGPHALDPHRRLLQAKATLLELVESVQGVHHDVRRRRILENPAAHAALAELVHIVPILNDPSHLRLVYLEGLNARKALHSLMGQDHEAIEDGLTELRESPDDASRAAALHGVALAYLRLDQPQEALRLLNRHGDHVLDHLPESRLLFAAAARRGGDPARALELLAPLITSGEPHLRIEALEEQVRSLLDAGRIQDARAAVEGTADVSALVDLARALVERASGDSRAANVAYEQAIEHAAADERAPLVFQYADTLRQQDRPEQAADLVASLDLEPLPDDWLESAICTLYAGGRIDETRAALEQLQSRGVEARPSTIEIEAHLATLEGNLDVAMRRYRALLDRWPDRPSALLGLASVFVRLDRPRAARPLLQRLLTLPGVHHTQLIMASQAAAGTDHAGLARDLAYAALRQAYDQEDAHLNMVNVLTAFPTRRTFRTVRAETAVELSQPGREPWWVIVTADAAPARERHEHALDSPLARQLLGQTVGAQITLAPGDVYEVRQIISKFDNAERVFFQEGLRLFPLSTRFRRLPIPELGVLPEGIWDQLRDQHKKGTVALREVREQALPVLILNARRRDPEAAFWDDVLAFRTELPGSTLDAHEELAAIRAVRGGEVIVHTSALLMLAHTHLLAPARDALKFYVTRHTLDDVQRAVASAHQAVKGNGRKTMYFAGEGIVLDEESPEAAEQRLERLQDLVAFVRSRAKVVSVPGLAKLVERNDLPPFLTASFSAVLAAHHRSLPLLCDDLGFLRMMTDPRMAERAPSGLTSVMLVDALASEGHLSAARATVARVALAELGQTVVRLDEDAIRHVLAREQLRYGAQAAALVRNMTHPILGLERAARHIAILGFEVCLHSPLSLSREGWLRQALDQGLGEHDLLAFSDAVVEAVQQGSPLLTAVYQPFLLDLIRRWENDRWRDRGGRVLQPPG